MTLGRNDKTLMPNKLPCGLVDNDLIKIAYVELSHRYKKGESRYGQCRYKKVIATTTNDETFLMDDSFG